MEMKVNKATYEAWLRLLSPLCFTATRAETEEQQLSVLVEVKKVRASPGSRGPIWEVLLPTADILLLHLRLPARLIRSIQNYGVTLSCDCGCAATVGEAVI